MTRALPLIFLLLAAVPARPAATDAERAAFRAAYAQAERGVWEADAIRAARLEDYLLWPDLRAAWLRARLGRVADAEVRAFLAEYDGLKPARELRYRFALSLAKRGKSAEYLALYGEHYADLDVERLDCLALAHSATGTEPSVLPERARRLWLVGHSQVAECDPVFARYKAAGLIDEELHRERFELAIAARQLAMARYLARSLPPAYGDTAARWTAALGQPRAFLDRQAATDETPAGRARALAAIERLAYDDPLLAARYWQDFVAAPGIGDSARAATSRHLALWLARRHEPSARAALEALDEAAVDAEVLRWRVRSALRERDWPAIDALVDALPADERDSPQWQYWRAVALAETGRDGAHEIFAALAGERSYYGFLAADALGADYDYAHRALAEDPETLARLAADPALQRARELFLVGLDSRGRSEWDAAMRRLTPDEQVQAAILADRWGWHSRAIATAAQSDRYDDLALRYPLPWAEEFTTQAEAARVSAGWALGVARSESLFMPDVRSSAGAIGLMQVMPATARTTARELNAPYRGTATLVDPVMNIRLGVGFLGNMHRRFGNNAVLATAAYNAGPLRVEDWLPRTGSLDARIWIETIPYAETRDYVRRVLTAAIIFDWRLHGGAERLSARLAEVPQARTAAGD